MLDYKIIYDSFYNKESFILLFECAKCGAYIHKKINKKYTLSCKKCKTKYRLQLLELKDAQLGGLSDRAKSYKKSNKRRI